MILTMHCTQHHANERLEVPQGPIGSSTLELDTCPSFNVRQLWRFMKKSNLLHDAFRWIRPKKVPINRLLEIVQVFFFGWNVYCATHDLLGAYPFSLRLTAYSTDESEAFVLAPSRKNLIDAKGLIDFSAVSHLTNFWKYHMAINDERDMHNVLLQLPSSQYPKTFLEQSMRKKRRLGMSWKGALCE